MTSWFRCSATITSYLSNADAYKAFTRGENAYNARQEAKLAKQMDEAPTIEDDGDNLKGDTLDDSSIVLENDEASYPYDEKSVIDGYEKAVDNKILDFINRIRGITDDSRKKKQYLVFSDVKSGSRLSKDIKRLTGITADGFKNRLDGNDFLHIEADHGKNGRTDHSMANDNDLARIGFVIDNYDTIEIVTDKNGTPDTDYEHQNSDQTPSKMVKMSKKINGTYYVVESVPDSKSKSVYIKSAYISKDGSKPRPLNMSKDPQLTPETLYSQNATTNGSISHSTEDVNTVISSMGSFGRTLYNKIVAPIAKNATASTEVKAAREGFAHVYKAGQKGEDVKRSKAGPLHIKEINAIYEAGKKDAAARVNVKKKTDARVIKDESFKAAKVSKRSERILDGVSKIIGRDIRFSDDVAGNAKIDLEKGEIVISTKAKTGHTWAMIHEVYHALVIDSPAEAEQLKKTVLDIAKKNPEAYKRFRKKYEITYDSELFDENNKMRIDASEYISEEMVADLVGFTLSEPAILEKLTGQQRNILQKFVDKLVSMFGNADAESKEEYFASRFGGDIRAIFKDVAREADSIAEQFKAALDASQKAEKNTVERDGVRSSKDITETAKISMEMTDSERANILKNKLIIAPFYEGQADKLISLNKSQLESEKLGLVKKAILIIAENFAPLNTSIDITDAEVSVVLSKSNLKESVTKDVTPEQLAKLLPILKETLSSAIAIERHNNRYFFDSDTVYFDNLFGGYIDGRDFVPVRFGLKHSRTGKTTLYVVVDQNKVPIKLLEENKKTEVVKTAGSIKTNQTASRSVTYSLSEIIPFVNSKDVLRYFPDDMLNEEQNKTKWQAIAETIKKTGEKNDKKYAEFIAVGNLSAANEMTREAAKYNGYTISAYHGGDQFFTEFSKGNKTSSAPEGAYFFTDNEDVAYSYTVYKNKVDLNKQNYPVYKQATPEGKIEENRVMHGGVYPVYLKIDNPYIVDFEGRNWGNKVDGMDINETVKWAMENNYDGVIAKNIIDPGDMGDVNYEIGNTRIPSTDFAIFDSTNAKSSVPIAYDDNGNVIPLSERFNPEKTDIRYSKELFPDDRTMSAEEIERDEIEQYIQQIRSSDDLSDADVQAIRQEIIQSRKQQREQLLAEIATTNLARWGADLGKIYM